MSRVRLNSSVTSSQARKIAATHAGRQSAQRRVSCPGCGERVRPCNLKRHTDKCPECEYPGQVTQ